MSSQESKLTTSDAELLDNARSGDTSAFGELWRRHYRSAARVARQFTSSIDADDLVSEAYARIFQRVLAGGGPTGAFRPYLYTTIRNLASTWGASARDVQVDVIEDFEDDRIPDDPAAWALDRTLTAQAFRSLPERWQSVLWYTEVEGMDPHEVAPLMGMTANGVAALSYRAREGLRKAWLQAHISDATASGECQWTMARLGDHARNGLGDRDRARLLAHLAECDKCTIVSEEVDEVGSHLALVLLPLILGGVAGGGLLAALAQPGSAMAEGVIPAMPHVVEAAAGGATAVGAIAAPVLGGISLGAATGTATVVGSLAVVAALTGGIVLGLNPVVPQAVDALPAPSASQLVDPVQASKILDPAPGSEGALAAPEGSASGPGNLLGGVDGTVSDVVGGVGNTVSQVVGGVGGVVGGVVAGITPGGPPDGHTAPGGAPVSADVSLNLSGHGTPGATVSAQVAGSVYTTVVAQDGHWSLLVTGLPQGTNSAKVSQSLGGLVGGLLSSLGIYVPLDLDLKPLGITVQLLN